MQNKKVNEPVLVVGADGTIGKKLVSELEASGNIVWQTTRRSCKILPQRVFLDLSSVDNWDIPVIRFNTVFLCASVTSYEQCQAEPELTWNVNVLNTIAIAKKFIAAGSFVIFLSTNAVFDGKSPLVKSFDTVNPQTLYGKQKAAVEKELLVFADKVAVVRLGKVITAGNSLFHSWIKDLKQGGVIHPFSDMFMAPVSIDLVVRLLTKTAELRFPGIIQLSASQDISYAEACKYIAAKFEISADLIKPVTYKDKGISFSPKYTALNCGMLVKLGFTAPTPYETIDEFLLNY